MRWQIVDVGNGGKPYIYREYATEAQANYERAQLLQPYPDGHEWRRRLRVQKVMTPEEVIEQGIFAWLSEKIAEDRPLMDGNPWAEML